MTDYAAPPRRALGKWSVMIAKASAAIYNNKDIEPL